MPDNADIYRLLLELSARVNSLEGDVVWGLPANLVTQIVTGLFGLLVGALTLLGTLGASHLTASRAQRQDARQKMLDAYLSVSQGLSDAIEKYTKSRLLDPVDGNELAKNDLIKQKAFEEIVLIIQRIRNHNAHMLPDEIYDALESLAAMNWEPRTVKTSGGGEESIVPVPLNEFGRAVKRVQQISKRHYLKGVGKI